VKIDRDSITRSGARAPGVKRKTACTEVLISTSSLTQSRECTVKAESAKDNGKPDYWAGLV